MAAGYLKLAGTTKSVSPYTVLWSKTSGPGTVTFSNAAALINEATFSAAGTYVLTMTVTTADFVTEDTVTVTVVANAAPVVTAGSAFSVLQSATGGIEGSYSTDGFPAVHFYSTFDTTVAGTPAAGNIRLNNANVTSATQMNIALVDRYGINRSADLLTIPSGSVILLVNAQDSSRWIQFTCGAFSLFGGYAICAMSSVTASNNPPFATGTQIDFTPHFTPIATWSMTAGTGTATFGDSHALATTVVFSTNGAKTLTLSVNDGIATGTGTVAVTVTSTLGTDFARATAQAVPGGVALDALGTPFMIDMSRFPNGWWTAVDSLGATIRVVYSSTTTQLPFDLVAFNKTSKTGLLVIKSQAFSAGTGVDVYCGNASNTAYAPTDTFGKYNVYRPNISGFWPSGGGADRTRNARNMITEGTPSIVTGPIGASAYTYSATSRSRYLFPAALPGVAISFFAASDTTSPDANSYFHTIGINRTVTGTLDSYNNSCYMTAAGPTMSVTMADINGAGAWVGVGVACTAETWKGYGGIHASIASRQAVTAAGASAVATTASAVSGFDHVTIGQFPKLLGAPGVIATPKVSLCFLFVEAVNPNELKYLDLMLKQSVFWGTWTLNS